MEIYNLEEKLLKMEQVNGSYLDHIASYIRFKKFPIENSKQLSSYITRLAREAKQLEGWSSKQVYSTMEALEKDYQYRLNSGKGKGTHEWKWTLESIRKEMMK